MTPKEQVQAILALRDWKQERLAEELGVAQSSVHRWLAGADPRGEKRDQIAALYNRLFGAAARATVRLRGKAGAGPDGSILFATGDGDFGEVEAPINATERTEALEVEGHSMRDIAHEGSLIFYDEKEPPNESHIGNLCVCWLADDRVMIKYPFRGRGDGLFDLESTSARILRDVPVLYFAHVINIVPRIAAQKLIRRRADFHFKDQIINR